MADKDGYEHINHTFQINSHQHGNVYAATSPIFLPYDSPNTLAMGMSESEAFDHYNYTNSGIGSSSSTNFSFYHDHPTKVNTVIAVGQLDGEPLLNWLSREMRVGRVWDYDTQGNMMGLQVRAKQLFHLLGAALAPVHEQAHYVGDILAQGRINSDFTRITFDRFLLQLPTQQDGIKKDIADFKRLVITLEQLDPPPGGRKCDVVELFKLMCDQAQNLYNLPELMEVSYFVCHNSISWDYRQRENFAFAFYRFRERDSADKKSVQRVAFDHCVDFGKKATHIPNTWGKKIPLNTIFDQVFKNPDFNFIYRKKTGLLLYHRSCYLHYHKYQQQATPPQPFTPIWIIDQGLMTMFPDAIPKAWYELYLNRNKLGITNFVDELKRQPGYLHYSKFP